MSKPTPSLMSHSTIPLSRSTESSLGFSFMRKFNLGIYAGLEISYRVEGSWKSTNPFNPLISDWVKLTSDPLGYASYAVKFRFYKDLTSPTTKQSTNCNETVWINDLRID